LAISATHKFNFFISLGILSIPTFYLAYQKKIFKPLFFSFLVILILALTPVYVDKFFRYQTTPIEFFLSPLGSLSTDLDSFVLYLIHYRENFLPFPFYLVFPSSLGTFSTVLGVGGLIAIYGLLFFKNNYWIFFIYFFVFVLYLAGQASTRFFLEPYIWTLMLFSYEKFIFFPFKKFLSYLIYLQAIFIIIMLSIFSFNFIVSWIENRQNSFMQKYANGYTLHEWAIPKIPLGASILLDHPSSGLTTYKVVSSSSLIFLPRGSVITHDFENELLRNKVNYVVTTSTCIHSLLTGIISCLSSTSRRLNIVV
jgi:hypothetical protein